jgi:hypothetical protein
VNPSYSALVGNSLKYFNSSSNSLKTNTLWKYHQSSKNTNISSVPAHVILTPSDNSNILNFMNLDNIGVSTVKDSTAFKKIQFFSKTNPTNLFSVKSDFQNSFKKVNNLYLNDLELNNSYTYGMDRQHTYTSLLTTLPNFSTLMDNKSIDKFFNYNYNWSHKKLNSNFLNLNRLDYAKNNKELLPYESLILNIYKLMPNNLNTNNLDLSLFFSIPNITSVIGAENDSKQYPNSFKFLLDTKLKKKTLYNLNLKFSNPEFNEYLCNDKSYSGSFVNKLYNTENTLKFKDYKSSNAQFLGSERTVRLLTNLNSNSFKWNTSFSPNTPTSLTNNLLQDGSSQKLIHSSSFSN